MVSSRGDLAIAELIFYVPAFVISCIAAKRHGFGRSSGWIFLVILSLARIIGGVAQLVAESNPTQTVITMALVLQNVGLSPLLLAQLGIMKRVHEGMHTRTLHPRFFNLQALLPLIGLILSIVGGIDISSPGSESKFTTGEHYSETASVLYLLTFILAVGVSALTALHVRQIIPGDRRLYYAVVISLPFLGVRCIYSMLVSFNLSHPDSIFNFQHSNIYAQAFMSVLEEFIVVILYLAAGMTVAQIARHQRYDNSDKGQHGTYEQYAGHNKSATQSGVVDFGH